MDIKRFKKMPLMGILRGAKMEDLEPLIETVLSSGLETIEITMNTKGAPGLIQKAVKLSRGRLMIGAGTVLTLDSLKSALDTGASFIVLPVLIPDVLEYCRKHDIPVFPGAFGPLEIYNAWRAGAQMVKVFPAKTLGPDYFKEIKGPFPQIELLACGGLTPENMQAYFTGGASAVAFGGSVFRADWLRERDYKGIGERLKKFVAAAHFFKTV